MSINKTAVLLLSATLIFAASVLIWQSIVTYRDCSPPIFDDGADNTAQNTIKQLTVPVDLANWPRWQQFSQGSISDGGRVIDHATDFMYTTSEGQSYALFFALVANQPELFARLLAWTENNLAQGDLSAHLPAWQWGKQANGTDWGVIDSNSAADSDLWISYVLLEAGRLWQNQRYSALGLLLAERILKQETVNIPGLGQTLLPAPVGFVEDNQRWRLNPSYSPIQVLRGLYHHTGDQQWLGLIASAQQLLVASAKQGFSPDWAVYQQDQGFIDDQAIGSYNAIRVYLWAGMLAEQEPLRTTLLSQFKPMVVQLNQQGVPPEKVLTGSGKIEGIGSVGFSGALLPFLAAWQAPRLVDQQWLRITAYPAAPENYYDQVLLLFGVGWLEKRYCFNAKGLLQPAWLQLCD